MVTEILIDDSKHDRIKARGDKDDVVERKC